MISPCIKKCKLEFGVCLGCRRQIHDIVNWKKYTDNEREKIMSYLIDLEKIEEMLGEYYKEYEIQNWLDKPHPQLENKTAREEIQLGNAHKVYDILERLKSDVYI